MTTLLRLRIEADWPAQHTRCEWALYETQGRLTERGASDPQHWPQADVCELALTADQCLALEATLPKGARRNDPHLVRYAVEEHLVGDINSEHIVAGETRADGKTTVWVISRARLAGVLSTLSRLGRRPVRAYSELQLAPLADASWTVGLYGTRGYVRLHMQPGFAFEVADARPPVELRLAVETARAQSALPREIDVYHEPDSPFDADAWHADLGVSIRRAGNYAWHVWSSRGATNLLVGEFSPPRARYAAWTPFKPAAILGGVAVGLYMIFSLGQWAWMDHRANALRAQTTEIFRAAFPQVQTIVDPVLQMQRLYDPMMRERGRVGESDFLPLLAAVTEALGTAAQYRSVSYDGGRIEFTVTLKDNRVSERLRETLARYGLMLTVQDTRQTPSGTETTFSVRFGT